MNVKIRFSFNYAVTAGHFLTLHMLGLLESMLYMVRTFAMSRHSYGNKLCKLPSIIRGADKDEQRTLTALREFATR